VVLKGAGKLLYRKDNTVYPRNFQANMTLVILPDVIHQARASSSMTLQHCRAPSICLSVHQPLVV
jgi:hypothetical protein